MRPTSRRRPRIVRATPDEEAAGFILPAGYRMELVAAEPDVISPSLIEFDGNGRMYVGEMISYMMDAGASREHDPISRISRWESTKGDGRYDKHTVFVDHLVAPRMILPLQDGVILTSETDSDDLVKWSDTNGDGVADKREVVFTGLGQSGDANIEHQKAGLLWNMDNWIYTTYNPFRIRWTPSGFLREPTGPNGGQWGLASDDDGKPWFVDAGGERGPMNFQYPIHYGAFTPCAPAGRGGRGGPAARLKLQRRRPIRTARPAWRTVSRKTSPSSGRRPASVTCRVASAGTRMPAQNLNHFTATTGPAIVRGDALPADMKGDLLFTEPVGRLDPARGHRKHRRADAVAERLSGCGVHHERRPAVPAGEHQQRTGRHDLHRRHVPRHHPGAAVVGPGIVPAREDRAVSVGQGRLARPHLASALRRTRRRALRPTRTSVSRRFPRFSRTSRRRRCTARRRRSSSSTSRIRTAGGATRRSACSC